MYKSERMHRRAAPIPALRDMPFDIVHDFQTLPPAKNDPVGREFYAINAYGSDERLNFVQRN